jgi:hypothetical protein
MKWIFCIFGEGIYGGFVDMVMGRRWFNLDDNDENRYGR